MAKSCSEEMTSWSERASCNFGQISSGRVPHGVLARSFAEYFLSLVMTASESVLLSNGSPNKSSANCSTLGMSSFEPIVALVA